MKLNSFPQIAPNCHDKGNNQKDDAENEIHNESRDIIEVKVFGNNPQECLQRNQIKNQSLFVPSIGDGQH